MNETQHTQAPGLAYQAVKMYADHKQYATALARAIRHIEDYKPADLEKKGITNKGKVNAEGLMVYINKHIAKPMLGQRNFDSSDAGYLANFLAIKRAVEQYGRNGITNDLLERVIATYLSTSTQHVAQKDVAYAGSLPTSQGLEGVKKIAKINGQDVTLAPVMANLRDPSEVSNFKGQLEEPLRQKVEEAVATGTLEEILKQVQGAGHGPH